MENEGPSTSMWDVALQGVIAYQKTMDAIEEGRRHFRENYPVIPPPPSVLARMARLERGRVKKQNRGRRLPVRIPASPSMADRKIRNPLVGKLRGKLVPWVFGAPDDEFEVLVGVSAEEFRQHIASQFTDGMSWANHGYWHLDHILPVASFDHDDPEQVKRCWNVSNFQPLWGRHNLQKSKKLNYGTNPNRTNPAVEKEES
jgi:hypothetical protein